MEQPSYYAIIPADVRYDNSLRPNEKMFYGEITTLTQKNGECWASNNYFANLYNVKPNAISNWVKHLKENGYINVKYEYKGKEIEKRIITIVERYSREMKEVFTRDEKGYSQKGEENNTSYSNNTRRNISIVEQAIDYMNELAGTTFKATTKKTIQLINARLKEGFDIEDIKDVIYFKYNEWVVRKCVFKNGVSSDTYYRPNTLFSTNFEEYLQQYKKEYK